jgi:CheY-like chemotaxis protein
MNNSDPMAELFVWGSSAMVKAKVLCVDDNEFVLQATQHLLESSGYVVVTAATGRAALACMTAPFSAAILDYELPDMNGAMVARQLREQQQSLPIILFSGSSYISPEDLSAITVFVEKTSSANCLLDTLSTLAAVVS